MHTRQRSFALPLFFQKCRTEGVRNYCFCRRHRSVPLDFLFKRERGGESKKEARRKKRISFQISASSLRSPLPYFFLLCLLEQRRRLLVCFFKRRIVAIERWVGKSEQEDFKGQVCSWTWDDLDNEQREKTISIFFFSPPLRFFFSFFFEYFLLFRFSLLQ